MKFGPIRCALSEVTAATQWPAVCNTPGRADSMTVAVAAIKETPSVFLAVIRSRACAPATSDENRSATTENS